MSLRKVKVRDGYQPIGLHEGYQPILQHGYQPISQNSRQMVLGNNVSRYRPVPPKTASNVIVSKKK